jgi:AcrR family transcriptional regulator
MARPTQDPQIRINAILDAAETLLYVRGYHQMMISDIVKKSESRREHSITIFPRKRKL